MIGGIGVDACELARMQRALAGPAGARFRARVFTAGEQAYCEARGRGRVESYAARFAAKEAAMKALGTGWGQGVGFLDVEVRRDGDDAPRLFLHGAAARLARRRRLGRWHVALTHTRSTAIAWVLAERNARRR
jgi:holo-[acyl-carrier protein] synthase